MAVINYKLTTLNPRVSSIGSVTHPNNNEERGGLFDFQVIPVWSRYIVGLILCF